MKTYFKEIGFNIIHNDEDFFKNYDKCFKTSLSLDSNNSSIIIPMRFEKFGTINNDDFIKVGVIDQDKVTKTKESKPFLYEIESFTYV